MKFDLWKSRLLFAICSGEDDGGSWKGVVFLKRGIVFIS